MALIDTIIQEVISVFKNDQQVFNQASYIKVEINPSSKSMEHPLESGAIITDHRIILPTEITLYVTVNYLVYRDLYAQMQQYFLNGDLLTLQTRSGIYNNLIIEALPVEQNSEQFNLLVTEIKLKEVLIVKTNVKVVPKNPKKQPINHKGEVQPQPTPEKQKTAAAEIAEKTKKWFN